MTDSGSRYTEPIEVPIAGTQPDQIYQELSGWLWDDMQSPVSAVLDALTRPGQPDLSPVYLDLTLANLYVALEEPICRAAGAGDDFQLLASASERGVTALDGVNDANSRGGASSARAALLYLVQAKIDNPKELAKFKEDMEKFEQRASTQAPPLPAAHGLNHGSAGFQTALTWGPGKPPRGRRAGDSTGR